MDKFTTLTGVAVPINMTHVDTDRIIPKNYLKTIKRTGLGKALFAEMRYDWRAARIPSSSSTRGPSARRPSWWLARTSAAGRAASTRRGRCSTSASAA